VNNTVMKKKSPILRNNFAEVSKNLDIDLKIILFVNHQNNYVECSN